MDKQELERTFIVLVEEHRRIIYKVCYIYATDKESLNDLYQEVVINLWKAYPRFRGECAASTWVYRIGLNTCISFFHVLSNPLLSEEHTRDRKKLGGIEGVRGRATSIRIGRYGCRYRSSGLNSSTCTVGSFSQIGGLILQYTN